MPEAEDLESLQAEETPTSAETPTETPTEEVTPETAVNQESATATDGAETEEEDDGAILSYVKEKYGEDLAAKYADDDAMIKGLIEAHRLVGQRNESAKAWEAFQKSIAGREAELQAFLEGRPAQPQKQEKAGDVPEFDPAWQYQITQDDTGNWVPAKGAPKDVVEKYKSYLQWREQRLNEIVRDPQKFLGDMLSQKSKELESKAQQAIDQRLAVEKEQLEVDNWFKTNKGVLYDTAGKETMVHQRAKQVYQTELEGVPDGVRKYAMALKLALAEQPKSPVKKPSPHASRKTPVSPSPPEPKTMEDYMKEDPKNGFARYLADRAKAGVMEL